jgi:hypothetical protein
VLWLGFLDFFVLDDPVVVLIEEAEDLSQVLGLLLEELVEYVVLRPFDLVVVVQIVGFQQFFLDLSSVEVLQVLGLARSFDIASALFHHFQNCIELWLPDLGVRKLESSLRSALRP